VSDPDAPVPDSLLGSLEPPAPRIEAVRDFDAAVDRANRVIALFSAQLAQERARPVPDPQRIAELIRSRDHYIEARNSLSLEADPATIAALHHECVRLLRAARGQP
jgi:hypothetical protein